MRGITGRRAAVIKLPKGGYRESSFFVKTGEKEWQDETWLDFTSRPYYIWVDDWQVHPYKATAEETYIRPKGSNEWVVLVCVEDNQIKEGKWSGFIANKGSIRNPCGK